MNWIPLESNPDVLNRYISSLGVKTHLAFTDVYSMVFVFNQRTRKCSHSSLSQYMR